MEEIARQAQLAHRLAGEDALVGDIVDGEDRARAHRRGPARPAALEDERDERALPVVGVDRVGKEVLLARRLQRAGAEQGEALVVVAVVAAALAVELAAVVPGILQEEIAEPLGGRVHEDVRAGGHGRELHLDPTAGVAQAVLLRVDDVVLGDDAEKLVPALGQCPREGADDVSQPAGLDVGRRLRSDEEDFHLTPRSAGGRPRPPRVAWD